MELGFLLLVLIITVSMASKTSQKVREKSGIDSKLIFMELQRNKLDEKTLTQYLTLLNDYNIKLSSPNHTAMMWLTRVNAKSELKMAITKLEEFHKQNFEAIE